MRRLWLAVLLLVFSAGSALVGLRGLQKTDPWLRLLRTVQRKLQAAGLDVALDDRGLRPGAMFADMELIGIPHRVVVSERGLAAGTFEYRSRRAAEAESLDKATLLQRLQD